MVGEIRDLETAKMAADSAITGHQVFSTLHTNDASAVVNRLVEMGVPPLPGGRRLALLRRPAAGAPALPALSQAETTMTEPLGGARAGRGAPASASRSTTPVGCTKCFGTGYRGRLGLYEVLVIDDELREMIATGGTRPRDPAAARAQGVASLRDDGVRKVLDGATSYLELLRVTS